KSHRIGPALERGALHQGQTFVSLVSRINDEIYPWPRDHGRIEERRRGIIQGGIFDWHQDLPEVVVDGAGVVDDQNSLRLDAIRASAGRMAHPANFVGIRGGCGGMVGFDEGGWVHDQSFAGASGNSRVKVAPRPGPSLCTRKVPPISLAASAPL